MVIHAATRGLVLTVTLLGAVAAYAHAHLARANPAAGAIVASAPSEVTLAFTQKLEPKFSTVVVRDGVAPGFHRHDEAEGWQPFRPFPEQLHRDPADPQSRFLDVTGDGRVAASEVMIVTGRVQDLILNPEETGKITEVIGEGEYYGMRTFDQSLLRYVMEGKVTEEVALEYASSPHDFKLMLAAGGRSASGIEQLDSSEEPVAR